MTFADIKRRVKKVTAYKCPTCKDVHDTREGAEQCTMTWPCREARRDG